MALRPGRRRLPLEAEQALVKDVVLQISSVNQQVEVQGEAAEIATQNVAITATVKHRAIGEPAPTDSEVYRGFVLDSRCRSDCHRQADVQGPGGEPGMLVVDSAETWIPSREAFRFHSSRHHTIHDRLQFA